ncbi:hypothetical protein AVEN_96578-1 [Araneus ventricosus]|uniref:Uncharacterized protein n=1 Tax=Araneus ventricosus TaxID=182803 RepID=A0A4Y2FYY7_ARAVE|nr:hypothetical protein AVEN_96578-1 [Araneus ventricosus]
MIRTASALAKTGQLNEKLPYTGTRGRVLATRLTLLKKVRTITGGGNSTSTIIVPTSRSENPLIYPAASHSRTGSRWDAQLSLLPE